MTNKLVVIINSLKVPKIEAILLYEMKFIVPNYGCLQNPWIGGYAPNPRSLCPLSSTEFVEPPTPRKKIRGYATGLGKEKTTASKEIIWKTNECSVMENIFQCLVWFNYFNLQYLWHNRGWQQTVYQGTWSSALLTKCHWSNQIKEDEMGWAFGTMGKRSTKVSGGKSWEKQTIKDQDVDGIMFKWVWRKSVGRAWSRVSCSGCRHMVGFCEHVNEPSGFIKCWPLTRNLIICTPHQISLEWSTQGGWDGLGMWHYGEEVHKSFRCEIMRETDHLEDQDVDGIMFKWVWRKSVGREWSRVSCSGCRHMVGFCEHVNEPSGSIKCGPFLD